MSPCQEADPAPQTHHAGAKKYDAALLGSDASTAASPMITYSHARVVRVNNNIGEKARTGWAATRPKHH